MKHILIAMALFCGAPVFGAEAVFLDRLKWFQAEENFGGFSGIEVSANGQIFTVISDRGFWTNGAFTREDGHLTSVTNTPLRHIKRPNGAPATKLLSDAEGLALSADGKFFVSFESFHRVWSYAGMTQNAQRSKGYEDIESLQNNSGLEALAIDANGVLYTLPERSGEWERPFPVYRFKDGGWSEPFKLPRRDKYLPVGADFGPDGKFYLLERDFVWYKGFSNRIRRFDLTSDGFVNEEILLSSPFGKYDNLEGISAWLTATGEIRLTTIADNNFSAFQTTEFVEFAVREDP